MQSGFKTAIKYMLLALCAWYAGAYAAVASIRLFYPYELEWMEGAMAGHVVWILKGNFLYVRPTIDFVPFIYGPLYFYASALVSKITGIGLMPLRLISVISSIAVFALLYLISLKLSKDRISSIIGASLFFAVYNLGGSWLDIARVDSLYLMFLMLGFYLFLMDDPKRSGILSGIALSLAFFTKQSGLIVIILFVLPMIYFERKRAVYAAATSLGITLCVSLLLNGISGGWFKYYIFDLPASHPYRFNIFFQRLWADYKYFIPLFIAAGIMFNSNRKHVKENSSFYIFLFALVASSILSRLHSGGYVNCSIPAYTGLSVLASLVLAGQIENRRFRHIPHVLMLIQMLFLLYNPKPLIPDKEDRKAGDDFIERLRKIDGEVLVTGHGIYGHMAGKQIHAHGMAVADVRRGRNKQAIRILNESISERIKSGRIKAIVRSEGFDLYGKINAKTAKTSKIIYKNRKVFKPVIGAYSRPRDILYLRQ